MKENDPNVEADFWAKFVGDAIELGEDHVVLPMAIMTDSMAISLATRLNISVKALGTDHVFERKQRNET